MATIAIAGALLTLAAVAGSYLPGMFADAVKLWERIRMKTAERRAIEREIEKAIVESPAAHMLAHMRPHLARYPDFASRASR